MKKKDEISANLLPYDGEVRYCTRFIHSLEAFEAYDALLRDIAWEHDEYKMFGKTIITKRKVAWYGAKPYSYSYSHKDRIAHIWNGKLLELKELIEIELKETFNACFLNLYPNGTDGMGWHSDDEKELVPNATIASLSLGSNRKFSFKHRTTKEKISINLEDGSLLLMKGEVQKYWLHQLSKTKRLVKPRINLTFRSMIEQ